MDQEPSHWSERARLHLSPLPASRSGTGRPPGKGRPSRRKPSKRAIILTACTVCALAAAAALVWYFTSSREGPDTASTGTTSPAVTSTVRPGTTGSSAPSSQSTASTSTGLSSTTLASNVSTSGVPPSTTTTSAVPGSTTSSSVGPTSTAPTVPSETKLYQDTRLKLSFRYPSSWGQLPLDAVSELTGPPTSGIAVGDPSGASIGTTPANYIFFGVYEDPSQTAPPARSAMEEWAAMVEPESPQPLTVIEPLTDFQVNGVAGASKTYSLEIQGHPLIMKVCFLSAATCVYIFTFRAEEQDWNGYQALFDAVLNSFTVVVNQ